MTEQDKEEERKRVIEVTESRGDFVTAEDGFVYFWPTGSVHGCIASVQLRWLADELDRRNKQWEDQVNAFFSRDNQNNAFSETGFANREQQKG
jgi:hypothetical protein